VEWTMEQLEGWIGRKAIDPSGAKIGNIADVYVDDAIGEPEWLAVVTGLFGSKISFVPLEGAREQGEAIAVPRSKADVKGSPTIDVDGELSEDEERRLYQHYGIPQRSDVINQADAEAEYEVVQRRRKLQESGSVSIIDDSPEIARGRLRRRDQASVRAIDLRSDDV